MTNLPELSIYTGFRLPGKAEIEILKETNTSHAILGINNEVIVKPDGSVLPENVFKLRWWGGSSRAYNALRDSILRLIDEGIDVSLLSWLRPTKQYIEQKAAFLDRMADDTGEGIKISIDDCEGFYGKHGGASRINKTVFAEEYYSPIMTPLASKMDLGLSSFGSMPRYTHALMDLPILKYGYAQTYEVFSSSKKFTHHNIYRPGNLAATGRKTWQRNMRDDQVYVPCLACYWQFHPASWFNKSINSSLLTKDQKDFYKAHKQTYAMECSYSAAMEGDVTEIAYWSLPHLLMNHKKYPAKNRAARERKEFIINKWK